MECTIVADVEDLEIVSTKSSASSTHKIKLCHKSTKSGLRNTSECEECQRIIDAIFGDGKYGESATNSYQDGLDIQAMDRSKLSQIMTQIQVSPETKLQKYHKMISQALGGMEDNAANEIPTKLDANILKAVETEKQNEQKLITKVENLNEHDNVELPLHNEKRGPAPNEINNQNSIFSPNKINNDKFDLEEDFIAVTKQCLNVLPEHIDGLILKQLEVFNRPKSRTDEHIIPPLSHVVNNIINNDLYSDTVFFKREKGDPPKQPEIKRKVIPKPSPKTQNTETPAPIPVAQPRIIPIPSTPSSSPGPEKLAPSFQPSITDKPLNFEGTAHYDIDSHVFHMEAFLAPCREVILDDHSGDKRKIEISEIPTNVEDNKVFKEAANVNFNENSNEKVLIHSVEGDLKRHVDKGIVENYASNTNSDMKEEFTKSLQINKREINKKYNLYVVSKDKKEKSNLNETKIDAYNLNANVPTHANRIEHRTEHFVLNTKSNINEETDKPFQSKKSEIKKKYDSYITVKPNNYSLSENETSKSGYPLYNPQYFKPISSCKIPDVKHIIKANAKDNNMEREPNKIHSQNLNMESTKVDSPLESDSDKHQSKSETQAKHIIEDNMAGDPKIKSTQNLKKEPETLSKHDSEIHQSKTSSRHTLLPPVFDFQQGRWINAPNPKKGKFQIDTKLFMEEKTHDWLKHIPVHKQNTFQNTSSMSNNNQKSVIQPTKDAVDGSVLKSRMSKYKHNRKGVKLRKDRNVNYVSDRSKPWLIHPTNRENPLSHILNTRLKDKNVLENNEKYAKNISNFKSKQTDENVPLLTKIKHQKNVQVKNENIPISNKQDSLINSTNTPKDQTESNEDDYKFPNTSRSCCYTKEANHTIKWSDVQRDYNNEHHWHMTHRPQTCYHNHYMYNNQFYHPFYKSNHLTQQENENKPKDKVKESIVPEKLSHSNENNTVFLHSGIEIPKENRDKEKQKMEDTSPIITQNIVANVEKQKEGTLYDNRNDKIKPELVNNPTSSDAVRIPSIETHKEKSLDDDRNDKMKPESVNNPISLDAFQKSSMEKHKEKTLGDNRNDTMKPELVKTPTSLDAVQLSSMVKHKEEILDDNRNDKMKPELVNNPTSLNAVQIPSMEKHKEKTLDDNEKERKSTTLDAVQNILNVNAAQIASKEEAVETKTVETESKVEKKISLQQMLKEVRERNRREAVERLNKLREETDDPVGKCGDKKPPCPPPPPSCPPPPPPSPCPKACPKPEPKPSCPPEPCGKERKPCPKKTCFTKLEDTPHIIIVKRLSTPLDLQPVGVDENDTSVTVLGKSMSHLKEVLVDCTAIIEDIIDDMFFHFNNSFMARSFDPWTPIPSWPIPKREKRRPFICPKEGCPHPLPKWTQPCREKPCQSFPKRER